VVIEIDGSSHDDKQEYDAERDAYLKGLGLTVIHVKDSDVKKNLQDVMEFLGNHKAFQVQDDHPVFQTPLQRRGMGYKSSGGKMVWNEELNQEIPDGWEIKQLSNICSKIGSGATPKGGKASYRKSGISLIRSLNVHDYNFLFKDLAFIGTAQAGKLANVDIEQNDVLLNITGVSVARCCRVPKNVLPARVNQHVSIVRLEQKMKSTAYLLCNLCSENSKAQLLGTSHAGST